MSVETLAVANRADLRVEVGPGNPTSTTDRVITMIAVYDGSQWASISPELDIASVGKDAAEALSNLESAIREAVAFAGKAGLEAGRPVPQDELLRFISSHTGTSATVGAAIVL